MSRATKPRATDVARWSKLAQSPEPNRSKFGGACLRDMLTERRHAISMLSSWGLGLDGPPVVKAVAS